MFLTQVSHSLSGEGEYVDCEKIKEDINVVVFGKISQAVEITFLQNRFPTYIESFL